MKRFIMPLCVALYGCIAVAQQSPATFGAGLTSQLQVNTTTIAAIKKLLGEPGFLSTSNDGSTVMQFRRGTQICMAYFSQGGLLTGFMLSGGERSLKLPSYEQVKLLLANPAREELQKKLGQPLEIKVNGEEILWWYKDEDRTLGLIFREGKVSYNYAEQQAVKTVFSPATIDFLQPRKTLMAEVAARLGQPSALQYTNEGEDRIYQNSAYTLRLKADTNNIIIHFYLEGLEH
jgi:hypothetical protein